MAYLRDNGAGITVESLKFWNENKDRIGKITHVEVSFESLLSEEREENGITYPTEYNFIAFGSNGAVLLSGCNSGYFGEGPHGTAKILVELGLDKEIAKKIIGQKTIHYDVLNGMIGNVNNMF